MIIGQIVVNGVSYSCHRYPDATFGLQRVRRALAEVAIAEQLTKLGRVEIRVHQQRGLDRLRTALFGARTGNPLDN